MIFFKPKISFKLKSIEDCTEDAYNRCALSTNRYERQEIKKFLNINETNREKIFESVKQKYKNIASLEQKVRETEKIFYNYLDILNDAWRELYSISKDGEVGFFCFFDILPLPFVDFVHRAITLPLTQEPDVNAKNTLDYLIKYLIICIECGIRSKSVNLLYDKNNKYFIMAEFVADAIFYNNFHDTKGFPSSKSFYHNMRLDNERLVDKFRREYKQMPIKSFIKFVLEIVDANEKEFRYLTNRY